MVCLPLKGERENSHVNACAHESPVAQWSRLRTNDRKVGGYRHHVSIIQSEFSEFLRQRRRRILTVWHWFQFSLGTTEKEPKECCFSHDARKCKVHEKLIATLTEANQPTYKRRMFVKKMIFSFRYLRPWSNASVTCPYPISAACSIPYSFAICAVLLAVKNANFNGMRIVLNERE